MNTVVIGNTDGSSRSRLLNMLMSFLVDFPFAMDKITGNVNEGKNCVYFFIPSL